MIDAEEIIEEPGAIRDSEIKTAIRRMVNALNLELEKIHAELLTCASRPSLRDTTPANKMPPLEKGDLIKFNHGPHLCVDFDIEIRDYQGDKGIAEIWRLKYDGEPNFRGYVRIWSLKL
jgi:hypothetical protein